MTVTTRGAKAILARGEVPACGFTLWIGKPSFYGGVSFLFNGGGNNRFKGAWLTQGSAYFLSAGILVAEGSNNEFIAESGSQGQGLHLAAGLLLSKGGCSKFNGGWGSLGVGADRSVGMFIATEGNNGFIGGEESVGTARKPKALGVFMAPPQNTFEAKGRGRIQMPAMPIAWPRAVFLQCSGKFPKFSFTPSNTSYRPLAAQPQLKEVLCADYNERRRLYESFDLIRFKSSDVDLSELLANPVCLPEDQFNYAALWAIQNGKRAHLDQVVKGLNEGRFCSDYARRMAITLAAELGKEEVDPILARIMLTDSCPENRFQAALLLAKRTNSFDLLIDGTKSHYEEVRYAIAKGLQDKVDPRVLKLVKPLFCDQSFYVRRAAAMTATPSAIRRAFRCF